MPDTRNPVRFPNTGAPRLHFLHANGYPPRAYTAFLEYLAQRCDVTAMESRPLWPETAPNTVDDWWRMQQDLVDFLERQNGGPWIGCGHSAGGTVTLMAALKRPDLFQALAILDPPLFTPIYSHVWRWVVRAGLENRLHPLASGALRRRREFESRETMFDNYRSKKVFRKISDRVLWDYVDSLAVAADGGGVRLRISPDWEARIYTRGMLADAETWRMLPALKLPVIFLRAEHSNAFYPSSVRKIRRLLPAAEIVEIPGVSHLFPLESPQETAGIVAGFIEKSVSNASVHRVTTGAHIPEYRSNP